jgi:hypothetical protein
MSGTRHQLKGYVGISETRVSVMSQVECEPRTFAAEEDEAERVSRELPEQIARLRAEVQSAKVRLTRTAREEARDADPR